MIDLLNLQNYIDRSFKDYESGVSTLPLTIRDGWSPGPMRLRRETAIDIRAVSVRKLSVSPLTDILKRTFELI